MDQIVRDGEVIGEVVRCKDCIFYIHEEDEEWCSKGLARGYTMPDDYCSFGMKNEEV